MLELRAAAAVARDRRPPIWPKYVLHLAQVDHGLDREHVTSFHHADSLVVLVVWNVGRAVEEVLANPMTAVRRHDAEPVPLALSGDGVADLSVHDTRPTALDRLEQRGVRPLQQPHHVFGRGVLCWITFEVRSVLLLLVLYFSLKFLLLHVLLLRSRQLLARDSVRQLLRVDVVRLVHVRVESFGVHRDVEVDYVSLLKRPAVRYTMAHHFVRTNAH